METDKFEQHIKSKLQQREIEPSAHAWERISGELNSASKPKKSNFLWMGIAASVVVLMAVSVFYFTNTDDAIPNDEVVIEENTNPVNNDSGKEGVKLSDREPTEPVVVEKEFLQQEFQQENHGVVVVESKVQKNRKGQLSDNELNTFKDIKDTASIAELGETVIHDKVAEVLAKVTELEQAGTVTDAEVDSLLRKAQQDILKEKLFRTDASVDALALLNEVEDELDQSFRDQIFNSLKAGFIKVRTAVADRNN